MPDASVGESGIGGNVFTGTFYINTNADYREDATKVINWLMENSSVLNPYMKDVTTVQSVEEAASGTYD